MQNNRNRLILYLFELLSTFVFYYAVDTLFYLERGISSSGYLFFVVITFIVQLLFELPSGVLADKYSKRNILIFSQVFFIISTIVFISSHNYLLFVLGTVIVALQKCFRTGIVNSLIYESLELKTNFDKCLFIKNTMYYGAYMIAMPIGGYVAGKFGIVYTYYFTLFPALLSLVLLFFINENKKKENRDNKISKIAILKNGIKEINKSKIIQSLILTNGILLAIIRLVEESHPDYSIRIGISEFGIGIYTSLILLFCIIGNFLGTKIKSKYYDYIFRINPLLVGIFILTLGILNNKFGILFLLLYYIFSESFDIIMLSKIHNEISSESRVTVESIMSIVQCIIGIIIGSLVSALLNYIAVNVSYVVLGIILIAFSIYLNFSLYKINRKTN